MGTVTKNSKRQKILCCASLRHDFGFASAQNDTDGIRSPRCVILSKAKNLMSFTIKQSSYQRQRPHPSFPEQCRHFPGNPPGAYRPVFAENSPLESFPGAQSLPQRGRLLDTSPSPRQTRICVLSHYTASPGEMQMNYVAPKFHPVFLDKPFLPIYNGAK